MPRKSNYQIDDFLVELMQDYDDHLQKTGCFGEGRKYLPPSLTNDILPMFRERWVTGPTQGTVAIFPLMYPALQLASRLLTEHWTLLWFCRLTFGSRHRHPKNKGLVHIEGSPAMYTPGAVAQVRANLHELGKVISIMFRPPGYIKEAAGMTYKDRKDPSFYPEIAKIDWPPIQDRYRSSRYPHQRPCVVMNQNFQAFFMNNFASASLRQRYRFWFYFANVLVHEIAHAYGDWLHDRPTEEPLWCRDERRDELGASWERNVIGRVINPIKNRDHSFKMLFSMELQPCSNSQEYHEVMKRMWGFTQAKYTFLDAKGKKRTWPLLGPSEIRDKTEVWLDYPCDKFICAIHGIPMPWIVAWFQESEWLQWKQHWTAQGSYSPPALTGAFMLLYHRKPHVAQVSRPIVQGAGVDSRI